MFFSLRGQDKALAMCRTCPVRRECIERCAEDPASWEWGVWGGTTADERKNYLVNGEARRGGRTSEHTFGDDRGLKTRPGRSQTHTGGKREGQVSPLCTEPSPPDPTSARTS